MNSDRELIQLRNEVAQAAEDYLAKKVTWDSFIDKYGEEDDESIGVVVDLIEHEPKRGGFLGANEKEWESYQSQLKEAIDALRC